MMDYTVIKNEFSISTDKSKINIGYVHEFLTQSYWSPDVPIETVRQHLLIWPTFLLMRNSEAKVWGNG